MPTGTISLHRVIGAPAEVLYRAVIDPAVFAKWCPPYGFTATVHQSEAGVGGGFRASLTNFRAGSSRAFGGTYLALEPGARIGYVEAFGSPDLPGTMTTTMTLAPVSCGTELNIAQQGLPEVMPVEVCRLGWQDSLVQLVQLAQLVEADIPG